MATEKADVRIDFDVDAAELDQAGESVKKLDDSIDGIAGGDPLGPLGDSAEDAARKVEDTQDELKRLKAAFDAADRAFRQGQLDESFDEASQEAKDLRLEVEKTGRAFSKFASESSKELGGPVKALKTVQTATRRATRELNRFGKGRSAIDGLTKAMGRLRTVTSALAGLALINIGRDLARGLLGASKQALALQVRLQATTTALKETLGGSFAAQEGLAFLEKTSAELRIGIGDLSKNFVDLTAATKGTAVAGGETEKLFRAVIESGKVLGTTNEAISRSFLGLSQLAGRGTFSLEELRQVTENLPGSMQAFADVLGVSQKGLLDLVSSGTLGAEALIDLRKALDNLAGAGVSDSITDLRSAFDATQVAGERLSRTFGEELTPGVLDFATAGLSAADAGNALAAAIGAQLSGELSNLATLFRAIDEELSTIVVGFGSLADVRLPDFAVGATGINKFLDAIQGIPEAAKEAFEGLEEQAGDTVQTIRDRTVESFREVTAELDLSVKRRTEAEKAFVDEIGRIAEGQVEVRRRLLQRELEVIKVGGEERLARERQIVQALQALNEQLAEANAKALEAQLEASKKIAEEDEALTQKRIGNFELLAAQAEFNAQKRLDTESDAALKLTELEEENAAKRLAIQEEFLKELEAGAKKREDIERDTQQKLADLALSFEQSRRDILERQLQEEEEAANKRIALEKKVQEERRRAAEETQKILDSLGQRTAGTGGEGEDPAAQALRTVGEAVDELREKLDKLTDANEDALLDPDAILETAEALNVATLSLESFGEVTEDFAEQQADIFEEQAENARALADAVEEFSTSQEIANKIVGEGGEAGKQAADAFQALIDSYRQQAEAGQVSSETVAEFKRQIEVFLDPIGKAAKGTSTFEKALAAAAEKTKEQAKQAKAAAEGVDSLAIAQEQAATTAEDFEGGAEGAAEAADEIADTAAEAAEAVSDLATGSERAATGLQGVASAAGGASAALGGIAAAASAAASAVATLDAATLDGLTASLARATDEAQALADALQRAQRASSTL